MYESSVLQHSQSVCVTAPFRLWLCLWLLLFGSCTNYQNEPSDTVDQGSLKSVTLADLSALPLVTPPIESAKEALLYATQLGHIRSELEAVERDADFVRWNVEARLATDSQTSIWEVTIESERILPSYICRVSFTADGAFSQEASVRSFCEYLK